MNEKDLLAVMMYAGGSMEGEKQKSTTSQPSVTVAATATAED
eukprot:CAMPEP_0201230358 /NCGR_PEP_ID=MMETSP0852-20130820/1680_1 /ASSEMBLY_ACC=CAM_ASM_000632 /TAXON_ID=183588 /ORGANISM="Pseudo-nitzschia fraudulenta, Strain WWA7" /LENGTH=41 /DNA_ID= /DNA_START= /DNA_END= /DNA_ORIENTATION=